MNPIELIKKHYSENEKSFSILVSHSKLVALKALEVAERVPELNPDLKFIEEAAMLHDIGIKFTNAPEIGCNGGRPYICHGFIGRRLLEEEELQKHALVCERHTGVGISKKEIIENKLPLPERDCIPETIEEKIIAFADKFYSKNSGNLLKQNSLKRIRNELMVHGENKAEKFNEWMKIFKESE
ncbi:MAG TPA: HD domain-containing protein [archaeon]|nr:HD domain-containing protein [archaeon]